MPANPAGNAFCHKDLASTAPSRRTASVRSLPIMHQNEARAVRLGALVEKPRQVLEPAVASADDKTYDATCAYGPSRKKSLSAAVATKTHDAACACGPSRKKSP